MRPDGLDESGLYPAMSAFYMLWRIRSIRIVSGHIRFLYGQTDYINSDCIRSYPYFASLPDTINPDLIRLSPKFVLSQGTIIPDIIRLSPKLVGLRNAVNLDLIRLSLKFV